jgi:tetratricopeptide (TPR) repeat protein
MDLQPMWRYHLRLGDRFLARSDVNSAIDCYLKAGERLMDEGYSSMAAAVLSQVIRLDAAQIDARMKLAKLYQDFQLTPDMLRSYKDLAAQYERNGRYEQAREVIRILLDLRPRDIYTAMQLAEYYQHAS